MRMLTQGSTAILVPNIRSALSLFLSVLAVEYLCYF